MIRKRNQSRGSVERGKGDWNQMRPELGREVGASQMPMGMLGGKGETGARHWMPKCGGALVPVFMPVERSAEANLIGGPSAESKSARHIQALNRPVALGNKFGLARGLVSGWECT